MFRDPAELDANGVCKDQETCGAEPLFRNGGSTAGQAADRELIAAMPQFGDARPNRAKLAAEALSGQHLTSGHADANGVTLITTPHRWQWRARGGKAPNTRDGSALINAALVLLFTLAAGLLVVSYAAQYAYSLAERHQNIAAAIEAAALDLGMIIFSLLALGLARKGKSARAERALVVACATGSALMNFAPADSSQWRSVLAWVMPPIFLAVVVDRCVRTVQRHVLASTKHETDHSSPWSIVGQAVRGTARVGAMSVLYTLRMMIDRKGTTAGLKQVVINATPLPEAPAPVILADITSSQPQAVSVAHAAIEATKAAPPSKRQRLITAYDALSGVDSRYGRHEHVSQLAKTLAPGADLAWGTARTYLYKHVATLKAEQDG
jgi:hypothetical protein